MGMDQQGKSPLHPKAPVSRQDRDKIIQFLDRNRGKPQYRHAPVAGVASRKVMRPLAKKFGAGRHALTSQWPQIVGPKWASLCAPTKLTGTKGNKTLTITAKGPAATLIAANSSQIISQINQFLGLGSVQKIYVKQGVVKPVLATKTHSAPLGQRSTAQTTRKNEAKNKKTPEQELRSALAPLDQNILEQALNNLGSKFKSL